VYINEEVTTEAIFLPFIYKFVSLSSQGENFLKRKDQCHFKIVVSMFGIMLHETEMGEVGVMLSTLLVTLDISLRHKRWGKGCTDKPLASLNKRTLFLYFVSTNSTAGSIKLKILSNHAHGTYNGTFLASGTMIHIKC